MIVVLQVGPDVSNVWDVRNPTPGLDFEHEWNVVRENVRRGSGEYGWLTDDIVDRMKRLGWVFNLIEWKLVND